MAIPIIFDGKTIVAPGSYSTFKGGTTQNTSAAPYGKIMIIDGGSGKTFGGAGINGELSNRQNAVYEFSDAPSLKNFLRGGVFYDLADILFNPAKGASGVSAVKYVKAATTTAASMTLTVSGSGFVTKTGTITTLTSSTTVTGVGTKFTTEFSVGDSVCKADNTVLGVVASITSDTVLVLVANATAAVSAVAYKGQYAQTQGGTFTIKPLLEGIGANGFSYNGVLVKGFAMKLVSGVLDTTKYKIRIYVGNYRGVNDKALNFSYSQYNSATTYAQNAYVLYDGILFKSLQASNTGNNPLTSPSYWSVYEYNDNYGNNEVIGTISESLVVDSPEFSTVKEFIDWATTNPTFNLNFKLTSGSYNGSGKIDSVDLSNNSGYILATGATETYNSTDFDTVLDIIHAEDNTFFLCEDNALNAKSTNNNKILTHIQNDSDWKKFMVVGGGDNSDYFTGTNGSLGISSYYNTKNVIVVHSGVELPTINGGTRNVSSLYHAAIYLSRTCGLEPQVPTTWKNVGVNKPLHVLSKTEINKALLGGVVHTIFVPTLGWVINQSINSMQKNDNLVNTSGDSYEVSVERIKAQLDTELILNSRVQFVGGNLFTASAGDIKTFAEGYLSRRTARAGKDDLIISSTAVTVTLKGDSWIINYGFVPNSPINKLFFVGTILDANISI